MSVTKQREWQTDCGQTQINVISAALPFGTTVQLPSTSSSPEVPCPVGLLLPLLEWNCIPFWGSRRNDQNDSSPAELSEKWHQSLCPVWAPSVSSGTHQSTPHLLSCGGQRRLCCCAVSSRRGCRSVAVAALRSITRRVESRIWVRTNLGGGRRYNSHYYTQEK